jgi:ABC-type phosphate transport system substrate-binding protein
MKKIVALPIICLTASFLLSFYFKPNVAFEKIVVIVHKDNPIPALTASEVKLYYLRRIKKRWPEIEKNIRPADRKKKCGERDAFYSIIGLSDTQIEQYFVNKQLQNAERPPDKFGTDAEMITFVAEEIGAIGYIKASSVTPEVLEKVKIVFTPQF